MSDTIQEWLRAALRWIWIPVLAAVVVAGWFTQELWLPKVQEWIRLAQRAKPVEGETGHGEAGHDDHAGHGAHAGHDEADSIELSDQARKNIGLEVVSVELRPFERTITVPGIIVERPGRSSVKLAAPVTGIVTKIHVIQGQAVEPGERLFDLRLTHEEIVQAQVDFLRVSEELDVIRKEVARIETVVREGAIAGRTLVERNYELQLKEALFRANRQALLLHGLSVEQVEGIVRTRQLLSEIAVLAPAPSETMASSALYQVKKLAVERGQYVQAGQALADLTEHTELYIEGNGFEQDTVVIQRAVDAQANVTATVEARGAKTETLGKLQILYLAGDVDPETRASHFYIPLVNRLLGDQPGLQGRRFITWQYRPGQRVQVHIPVEQWKDRIVLPVDAVAEEGAESFVFVQNGKHFDRRPVHVEHRDPRWAVIANDGAIFPGDTVAVRGAHQLQLALKNKAGGGVDPHAGHQH